MINFIFFTLFFLPIISCSNTTDDDDYEISFHFYNETIVRNPVRAIELINLGNDVENHNTYSVTDKPFMNLTLPSNFSFFGYIIRDISISSQGFIHTGKLSLLSNSYQYIAPLKGNFSACSQLHSNISYLQPDGFVFHVKWSNLCLNGNDSLGPFTFQSSWFSNGTVVFGYLNISQSLKNGSVFVGLADSPYPKETAIADVTTIKSGLAIVFRPNINCNERTTCSDCLMPIRKFVCQWCHGANMCAAVGWTNRNIVPWLSASCQETATFSTCAFRNPQPYAGVIIFIIVIILIILVIILTAIFYHGYKHPTSTVGQIFVKYRFNRLCVWCKSHCCRNRFQNAEPYQVFYDNN